MRDCVFFYYIKTSTGIFFYIFNCHKRFDATNTIYITEGKQNARRLFLGTTDIMTKLDIHFTTCGCYTRMTQELLDKYTPDNAVCTTDGVRSVANRCPSCREEWEALSIDFKIPYEELDQTKGILNETSIWSCIDRDFDKDYYIKNSEKWQSTTLGLTIDTTTNTMPIYAMENSTPVYVQGKP